MPMILRQYLIVILLFPLALMAQDTANGWCIRNHADFEGMTLQYLTADADSSEIKAQFSDYESIAELQYWDSTKIMTDGDSDNTTQFLRVYSPDTAGIEADCFNDSHPPFSVQCFINSDTIFDGWYFWRVRFSEDFVGGDAGGKEGARVRSQTDGSPDTSTWYFAGSFETDDSLIFTYYWDYNDVWDNNASVYYTRFRFHSPQWYLIGMRINGGTAGESYQDCSWEWIVDGIVVDRINYANVGLQIRGATGKNWHDRVDWGHFFGGGGCSPNFPTWIDFDDFIFATPTSDSINSGYLPDIGDTLAIGDTIPMPIDYICEAAWTECLDFDWPTHNCDGGSNPKSGRTDGICAEAGNGTATRKGIQHNKFRKGVQYYFKRKGITYE